MATVTVIPSTKNLEAKIQIDQTAKDRVQRTIAAARMWVKHALLTVQNPFMSDRDKGTWTECFLAEATAENLGATAAILRKTYAGMCSEHTVKLSNEDYVRTKYGKFGGPQGSIHLAAGIFTKVYIPEARVWSYVHEASHKFANTIDAGDSAFKEHSTMAYMKRDGVIRDDKVEYRATRLTAREALNNADSYAGFVVMLWIRSKGRSQLS